MFSLNKSALKTKIHYNEYHFSKTISVVVTIMETVVDTKSIT